MEASNPAETTSTASVLALKIIFTVGPCNLVAYENQFSQAVLSACEDRLFSLAYGCWRSGGSLAKTCSGYQEKCDL